MRKLVLLAGALLSVSMLGCGSSTQGLVKALPPTSGPAVATPPTPRRDEVGDVGGVWDWIYRGNTQQGDLRLEQEEWHLSQDGGRISGYYVRQVTTLSSDQQPFRCNGLLGFTKDSRVRVAGELDGDQVVLREVGLTVEPNPCEDSQRPLLSYVGRVVGGAMMLRTSAGGEQHLVRRSTSQGNLAQAEGAKNTRLQSTESTAVVSGDWEWQFRVVDPDGDLHIERELWHLSEQNDDITGTYERIVERTRPSGVFVCNGSAQTQSVTRYNLRGQRFGDKLTITEIDFAVSPGPCETTRRRLDRYRGTLTPDGQLILNWSGGTQILRRKK
jgi:hypothetical protein